MRLAASQNKGIVPPSGVNLFSAKKRKLRGDEGRGSVKVSPASKYAARGAWRIWTRPRTAAGRLKSGRAVHTLRSTSTAASPPERAPRRVACQPAHEKQYV